MTATRVGVQESWARCLANDAALKERRTCQTSRTTKNAFVCTQEVLRRGPHCLSEAPPFTFCSRRFSSYVNLETIIIPISTFFNASNSNVVIAVRSNLHCGSVRECEELENVLIRVVFPMTAIPKSDKSRDGGLPDRGERLQVPPLCCSSPRA
jgi:hypothetical protein